ncbi:hypothetical protein B0H13DRAFT_2014825 [Mycena leptocephala]|nr:hypothetical protein B0H13DRAFT_2014825 [Mycena leptocephala]
MSFALPSARAASYVHAVVCLLPMLPLSFLADFLVPHIPAIHTLSPQTPLPRGRAQISPSPPGRSPHVSNSTVGQRAPRERTSRTRK